MNIYISTPINGRQEKTFFEKWVAAKHRAKMIEELIGCDEKFSERYDDGRYPRFTSTFTIHKIIDIQSGELTEEQALDNCVKAVLEADAIYLDHGWESSKGCRLEYYAAKIYGKKIFEHDKL